MKRTLKTAGALTLAMFILFGTACGGVTPESNEPEVQEINLDATVPAYEEAKVQAKPTTGLKERPNYALEEGADTLEQRMMILKAMEDQLTFRWAPVDTFTYQKSGAAAGKDFVFEPHTLYAGLPYSNAGLGLLHALEYYDFETGLLYDMKEVKGNANMKLGNSCAAAVNWALASVCPNMIASTTFEITPSYGYVTVGDYEFPADCKKYTDLCTTEMITNQNGEERMWEALALTMPGDVLITNGSSKQGDHAMMVYALPTVVLDSNGKIDPVKSNIHIIDQWVTEHVEDFNGDKASMRGRIDVEYTFAKLTEKHFLPMRAEDLSNDKGYEKATAELTKEVTCLEDLKKSAIKTNYRTVKVESAIVSESGNTVYIKKDVTDRTNYPIKTDRSINCKSIVPGKDAMGILEPGKTYTMKVRVLLATGDYPTICEFPVTLEDITK